MSRGITPLRVAEIRTQAAASEGTGYAGWPENRTWYRPEGVRLDNDGVAHHWIETGVRYTLDHDGAGWHVTMDVGANTHYWRMAAVGSDHGTAFVTSLPGTDGDVELDPANRYMLELVHEDGEQTLVLSQI